MMWQVRKRFHYLNGNNFCLGKRRCIRKGKRIFEGCCFGINWNWLVDWWNGGNWLLHGILWNSLLFFYILTFCLGSRKNEMGFCISGIWGWVNICLTVCGWIRFRFLWSFHVMNENWKSQGVDMNVRLVRLLRLNGLYWIGKVSFFF